MKSSLRQRRTRIAERSRCAHPPTSLHNGQLTRNPSRDVKAKHCRPTRRKIHCGLRLLSHISEYRRLKDSLLHRIFIRDMLVTDEITSTRLSHRPAHRGLPSVHLPLRLYWFLQRFLPPICQLRHLLPRMPRRQSHPHRAQAILVGRHPLLALLYQLRAQGHLVMSKLLTLCT